MPSTPMRSPGLDRATEFRIVGAGDVHTLREGGGA